MRITRGKKSTFSFDISHVEREPVFSFMFVSLSFWSFPWKHVITRSFSSCYSREESKALSFFHVLAEHYTSSSITEGMLRVTTKVCFHTSHKLLNNSLGSISFMSLTFLSSSASQTEKDDDQNRAQAGSIWSLDTFWRRLWSEAR